MNPPDQPAPNDPLPNDPSPYAPPPVTPQPAAPTPYTPPPVTPGPAGSAPFTPPPVAPGGPPPPPPYPEPPLMSGAATGIPGVATAEEKNWALAAHMSALVMLLSIPGVVGPLIVWLIKRDTMPYVNEHGKEAVNFQLTHFFVLLAGLVIGLITCSVGFVVTGPLMILDVIFAIVMAIIAGIKAGNGEFYRYPLCWRLIK